VTLDTSVVQAAARREYRAGRERVRLRQAVSESDLTTRSRTEDDGRGLRRPQERRRGPATTKAADYADRGGRFSKNSAPSPSASPAIDARSFSHPAPIGRRLSAPSVSSSPGEERTRGSMCREMRGAWDLARAARMRGFGRGSAKSKSDNCWRGERRGGGEEKKPWRPSGRVCVSRRACEPVWSLIGRLASAMPNSLHGLRSPSRSAS